MNNDIKITINSKNIEFETESPLKAFAFLTAVEHYDFDSNLAKTISQLSYDVYVYENTPLNVIDVIDFICENYGALPSDFNELADVVYNGIINYDL